MKNKTDEELAILVKSGDQLAVEELFKRYKPLLNKICHTYFLFGADNDDLMQEAMIGLYKACMTFNKDVASFNTYANICVKRKVIDSIKIATSKKNSFLNKSVSIDDEQETITPRTIRDPDQIVVDLENFAELKEKIFDNLSDFELLVLKYFLQGFDYSDIAKKLGKSKKCVDNALSRIKLKLKNVVRH